MARFINAEAGPKGSVIYTDENGRRFKYVNGTRNWRNNNPGNLKTGNVSHRHDQIGRAAGFAVFASIEDGLAALKDSLKNAHGSESLEQMIPIYAPSSDKNDVQGYLKHLQRRTGVKDDRKIKDFTSAQFESLVKAIIDMEGKEKPQVVELPSSKAITRVHKDKKGVIVEYFVPGLGWISKSEAIRRTKNGEIDAVVTTSRDGNLYLRARQGLQALDDLPD